MQLLVHASIFKPEFKLRAAERFRLPTVSRSFAPQAPQDEQLKQQLADKERKSRLRWAPSVSKLWCKTVQAVSSRDRYRDFLKEQIQEHVRAKETLVFSRNPGSALSRVQPLTVRRLSARKLL